MKKLAIAMMLGIAAMSASAQVNYKMQVACSPQDVKTYDTNRLRSSFLMEKVMVPNEINVTYSMYDRPPPTRPAPFSSKTVVFIESLFTAIPRSRISLL